jgi:hypothetical protein
MPTINIHRSSVRADRGYEHSYDVACERCGDDDPSTERCRPIATMVQWLCETCTAADIEALR